MRGMAGKAVNKASQGLPGNVRAYTGLRDDLTQQKQDAENALAAARVAVAKPLIDLLPGLVEDRPLLAVDMRRDMLARFVK